MIKEVYDEIIKFSVLISMICSSKDYCSVCPFAYFDGFEYKCKFNGKPKEWEQL